LKLPGTASPEGTETMSYGYTILGENIETTGDSFTGGCGSYERWLHQSHSECMKQLWRIAWPYKKETINGWKLHHLQDK
jgi:hypothetical protein